MSIRIATAITSSLVLAGAAFAQNPAGLEPVIRDGKTPVVLNDEQNPAAFYDTMGMIDAQAYDAGNGDAIGGGTVFGVDFDLQVVDDVRIGEESRLTVVEAGYVTFSGNAPSGGVLVEVFKDAGGFPAETPVCQICVSPNEISVGGFTDTIFGLVGVRIKADVSRADCCLPPGTYWIGMQPIDIGGDWYYRCRDLDSAIGADAHARDGGRDHGTVCGVGPFDGGYGTNDFTSLATLGFGVGDSALRVDCEPCGDDGLSIDIIGDCPGDVRVVVCGGTPGNRCALIYGFRSGAGPGIPGCPGLTADIVNPKVAGIQAFGSDGCTTFSGRVPQGACGRLCIQAFALAPDCLKSPKIKF